METLMENQIKTERATSRSVDVCSILRSVSGIKSDIKAVTQATDTMEEKTDWNYGDYVCLFFYRNALTFS